MFHIRSKKIRSEKSTWVIAGVVFPLLTAIGGVLMVAFKESLSIKDTVLAYGIWLIGGITYFAIRITTVKTDIAADMREIHAQLGQLAKGASVENIPFEQYYSRILACIERAIDGEEFEGIGFGILLSSFRPDDPETDKYAEAYHQRIAEIINSKVTGVKRLVFVPSIRKLDWVNRMMGRVTAGVFALRLHPGSQTLAAGSVPALNVQVIGNEHVFIVYAGTAENKGSHCLYLRSVPVANMFRIYYEAVWETFSGLDLFIPKVAGDAPGEKCLELLKKLEESVNIVENTTELRWAHLFPSKDENIAQDSLEHHP